MVGNHILIGVSGDFDNLGRISALGRPGDGQDTMASGTVRRRPGTPEGTGPADMTWMTGTYDPDPAPRVLGHGQSDAGAERQVLPGDNPDTCSIVAFNPNTEKTWAFQASPHDTHDWDAVEMPVLVDAKFEGKPKKMLMQTSRNGYFFVLDRSNGKSLLKTLYGPINWSTAVDSRGACRFRIRRRNRRPMDG